MRGDGAMLDGAKLDGPSDICGPELSEVSGDGAMLDGKRDISGPEEDEVIGDGAGLGTGVTGAKSTLQSQSRKGILRSAAPMVVRDQSSRVIVQLPKL